MKAITLTQPWATLVAIGQKRIETRSWKTSYRGPIAIHAAKGFPKSAKELMWKEPFLGCLREAGVVRFNVFSGVAGEGEAFLPIGAVIAVAVLANCLSTDIMDDNGLIDSFDPVETWGGEHEHSFGNYEPGRWMWFLQDIQPVTPAIPAKGALGLWEWSPP